MNETLINQALAAFKLTPNQEEAALARGRDVVVTAGAGSGKTSTLVARYVSLLAEGIDLRKILAVTFSDKAAMEMRSRVRKTLGELVTKAATDEERQFWIELNAKMDSARIGTIHGLCAEILREQPVEAVIDPRFEVLDENLAVALRVQIVDDIMSTLVGMAEYEPLFRNFEIKDLTSLLAYLLNKRLEVQEIFEIKINIKQVICGGLKSLLKTPTITDCLTELRGMGSDFLLNDAGDKLAAQVEEFLALWSEAETAVEAGDVFSSASYLNQARREKMDLRVGKRNSSTKEIVKTLRDVYDELINPICGGKSPDDKPPSAEDEVTFAELAILIQSAFRLMTASYKESLRQLGALDFDDLEYGATQLLKQPVIQEKWRGQIDALLVDEFQDTNQRQRDIVEALAGIPGRLFVVGDAKQSIYRFRRADVTVFRAIRQSIQAKGGLPIDLNMDHSSVV
jgi:ATP-dependent helicase/nuclease subunit A